MKDEIKTFVCETIDNEKSKLYNLSHEIWSHPETAYEEIYAHKILTEFLEKEGFTVNRSTPLKTSFVATYNINDSSLKNDESSLQVGLICEYDALPNIGHACGHNLIAELGVATALGLKAAIIKYKLNLMLKVIGTPAEEYGGGKIDMLDKGVFEDCHMVLMAHPAPYEIPRPTYLAKAELNVIYKGKASHAAAAPWEGINALDATVACYNSISMLRQQMKPTSRVHCIIKDGGLKPNIIPDRSELSFFIRGLTGSDMKELKEKVKDCANGAALQTGCSVEIKDMAPDYLNILTNEPFIQLYIDNAKSLGTPFNDDLATSLASTDMGNVSQCKPSIHPKFKITSEGPNHSINFTTASGAEENQYPTLRCAKTIALSVIDVLMDSSMLEKIKDDFKSKAHCK